MSPPRNDPEETGKMIRLERTAIGVNVIAGLALAMLLALVADIRGSITALKDKVESAIKDVAVLNGQNLDAHVRDLEHRMATVEAQAGGKKP